jgi:hypothetical protein
MTAASRPPDDTPLGTCEWREEDDDGGPWNTDCGQMFTFTDDGPKENGFKYCCYCGRRLDPVTKFQQIDREDADV